MVSGRTCRSTDTDGARSSVNAGSGLCMWIPCCTTLPVSPALIGLLCGCVQTNPRDRDKDLSGLPTACQHQPGYNAYNGCSFSFVNARNSGAGTNQSRDGRIYPGREPIRQLPVSTYLLPLQPPTSTGPVDPHTPNFEATYCLRVPLTRLIVTPTTMLLLHLRALRSPYQSNPRAPHILLIALLITDCTTDY